MCRKKVANILNNYAIQLVKIQKFGLATLLMKINTLISKDDKTYNNLASSLEYLYDCPWCNDKETKKIIKYYKKSLALKENNLANLNLGWIFFENNRYNAACKYLKKVKHVDESVNYMIAGCYFYKKNWKKSYDYYSKCTADGVDEKEYQIEMLLCMLECLIQLNRNEETEKLWKQLVLLEKRPRLETLYLAYKLGKKEFVSKNWKSSTKPELFTAL